MSCPKDKKCCWDCENGYIECDASGKPSAIICRLEQVDNTILKDELKVLIHSSHFAGNERQANIINQALKEIERLEEEKNAYKDIVDTCENGAREEFAEKLKPLLFNYYDSDIDNLLKEMRNK